MYMDKDIRMGSGELYAIEAEDFTAATYDVEDMVNIGYIKENAVFRRTTEMKEVTAANRGLIAMINGTYDTEFETGIIEYNANNVARFLTGSQVVTVDGTTTRTYFAEADKHPDVALVFVGEDDAGNALKVVIPRAVWVGDYELDFNNDDPVAFNYLFKCLNTLLPNGKRGVAFIDDVTAAESQPESTPIGEE